MANSKPEEGRKWWEWQAANSEPEEESLSPKQIC